MKSTRILPSVLIIATVLQTSNVYALNQEASANVSSVDSTEIARTLQTLKADYMDTIVDTDDFQSMYQQVQNQMASTEQLDLAEYYAQNYEITFPTENLYDLSDVDIASGYDSSATNAQYISLASQCMNTYSDYVDASGQSGNSMQLFQSQFGDVTKELSLSTPTLPEGYDMSHLVSSAASNVSDIYKDALSSSGVSSVKDSINTQWIFQKAASGPDAYSIQSYSKLSKMNSGGQEAQKTQKDLFDKATEANQNIYNNLNTDLTQKTQKELLKIVDTDSSVLFAGSDKQAAKNQLKQIKQATNASGKITRKVNAITDAASDSWNRLKNNVTAKSEDEIKEALQSNVEANKKDKWGLCGKKFLILIGRCKMSKIVCTYEDYDKMCEKFRIMRFQAEDYAPTLWDFSEYIEKNPAKYIDFLIWIDVTGITTEENKEARKMVRKFLCENLVLVDSLETEETK